MTFPVIESTANDSNNTSNQTTHTIDMPSGLSAGDQIGVWIVCDGSAVAFTFPDGWQNSGPQSSGPSCQFWFKPYESEGATITVTTNSAEQLVARSYRISGAMSFWTNPPVVSVMATGNSTTPQPNSLTTHWEGEDTLWLALSGSDTIGITYSGFPDNFVNTGYFDNDGGGAGVTLAYGEWENRTKTHDPSNFTHTDEQWATQLVAIRPVVAAGTPGFIQRKVPWTTRPASGIGIDKSHPVGAAIQLCYLATAGGDYQMVYPIRVAQDSITDVTHEFDGPTFSTAANAGMAFTVPFTVEREGTWTCIYRATETGGILNTLFKTADTNQGIDFIASINRLATRIHGTTINFQPIGFDFDDGATYIITVRYGQDGGAHQEMWIDGVETNAAAVGIPDTSNSYNDIDIGGDVSATSGARGVVNPVFYCNRQLSDEEIISLHNNVWQIFEPRTQNIPIDIADVSDYSYIQKKTYWTHQPPSPIGFDKSNFFGRHCIWALIPGWSASTTGHSGNNVGSVHSVGQHLVFEQDADNSPASTQLTVQTKNYGPGIGSVRTLQHSGNDTSSAAFLARHDDDIGIKFPNNKDLMIVTISKSVGDGVGDGDPRIFSQDEGTAADDHDLTLGISNSGNAVRFRIALDFGTITAESLSGVPEDDTLYLLAGGLINSSPGNSSSILHYVSETGKSDRTFIGNIGQDTYTPRTTTNMALGQTATPPFGNSFEGDILGVWAFDTAEIYDDPDSTILRQFFNNPWQVFKPIIQAIPIDLTGDAGTLYFQTNTGVITPAGAIVRDTLKTVTGTVTPSGTTLKETLKNLAGSLTPSGVATGFITALKTYIGTVTRLGLYGGPRFPYGDFTKTSGTLFFQTNTGTLTPAGALVKETLKQLTGVMTPSGVVTKETLKSFSGNLAPIGSLVKEVLKNLAGALTPTGALTTLRTAFQTIVGALTPTGALTKETLKSFAGSLTPSGALTRATSYVRTVVGSLTPTGALVKETLKQLAGSLTPSGAMSTIKQFVRTVVGGLTPTGALTKQTLKSFAGSLTPSGVLTRVTSYVRTVVGSLTPSGTLVKETLKQLAGSLTPSGVAAGVKLVFMSIAGTLTPVGALTKQTLKSLAGSLTPSGVATGAKQIFRTLAGALTPSGALTKQTLKNLAGSLTPSGVATGVKLIFRSLAGALTPAGALTKQTLKSLAGSLTPSGVLTRITSYVRTVVGSLTPVGALTKRTFKSFAGSLTPSGALSMIKAFFRTVSGGLTPIGTLTKQTQKSFAAALTPTGALVKRTLKSLAGSLTPSGALAAVRATFLTITGSLTPVGSLTKMTLKRLAGSLTPSGILTHVTQFARTLVGSLTPVGTLIKDTSKNLAGSLTPSGILTLAATYARTLVGSLTPSGALTKETQKAIAGTLSPSGAITKQTFKLLAASLTPSGGLSTTVIFTQIVAGVLTFAGTVGTTFIPGGGATGRLYRRFLNLVRRSRRRKSDDP